MKILSIAVPCYNSEAYMEKCIDSLLVGGEEVEILIVDDGSKDGTTEIADRYQEKYPTIVKAIHQDVTIHENEFVLCFGFSQCFIKRDMLEIHASLTECRETKHQKCNN